MTIDMNALPLEIRDSTRAVLWASENRNGADKPTKTPRQITDPTKYAAVDDPSTWGPFVDAVKVHKQGNADGVGIMFDGGGLVGVDLDGCRNAESGVIEPWAQSIVDRLDSYTEVSPSGTGLHIYLNADSLPGARRRKGQFEVYADRRYFTVSAQHIDGTPTEVEERTDQLAVVYHEVFGECDEDDPPDHHEQHQHDVDLDDVELLDRARAATGGDKFVALYDNGDVSSYTSNSEADLALANTLAFWFGCNPTRMDAVFRGSQLMRRKWDAKRGESTYGGQTIQRAIEDCRDTFSGTITPLLYISDEPESDAVPTQDDPDPTPDAYSFVSVAPEDHFLSRWISYGDARTDAAHEYHEAVGLALLAAATPTVRAQLLPYPTGLGTNLYELLVGVSTTTRKSTAKDLGQDIQRRAIPNSLTSDHFSPESFIEQLAGRPYDTMTLYVDEFAELMDKLHHAKHMAGLRGLLLSVYSGADYTYRRRSKRRTGGEMEKDEDKIESPHLNVLGCTTPAVFSVLREADVVSGLLPRFAIVMPSAKPARRPFHEAGNVIATDREELITWLAKLHAWSTESDRRVIFDTGVLDRLDGFAAQVETTAGTQSDTGRAMLQRLTPMVVKVAMLVAAGDPTTPEGHVLDVRLVDAEAAISIATRWQADALAFAARIGESEFERKLDRAHRLVQRRRQVRRIVVARTVKVDRRTLDLIRDTLADRGHIKATIVTSKGAKAEWWAVPKRKKGGR